MSTHDFEKFGMILTVLGLFIAWLVGVATTFKVSTVYGIIFTLAFPYGWGFV